ncbi:type II secretion system F family protein [Futiania mangrovi]|uniref:Type II secretion system F family protein n=1 Tax=Futiania mangrovi TaxID=2959716 RepID=A0A9J6PGL1_9PROT|nr:type II secretion system F family protein [Futiania mangrovii]MCP1337881.1 type II secretion system F family protein [Futiania mangrovii]
MRRYRYRALTGLGDVVDGEVDAENRTDAVRQLRERALDPLRLDTGRHSPLMDLLGREVVVSRGKQLALRRDFARDLAVLRKAGAPLDQALDMIGNGTDAAARLARRVAQRSAAGEPLSRALRAEPRIFDAPSIALLEAGEASGDLAGALSTLARLTDDMIATRSETIRALLYPAALLLAALLAIGLMIFHVLPSFERIFAGSGADIPAGARAIFAIGDAVRVGALPAAGALLAAIAAGMAMRSTEAGRRTLSHWFLRLPVAGRLSAGLDLGRALLIAGRLLESGSPADRAVELAGRTCASATFRDALTHAAERIREGAGVAAALAEVPLMPPRSARMIAIGEASGTLPRMLSDVADMLKREASATLDALLRMLPPALTVAIGVLVAGLVYAILNALLSINELALG